MSALFTVNFRRESYLRELARARARVVALGAWVAYFGVLTVLLGLYGLNCVSLAGRVVKVERQAERARRETGQRAQWNLPAPQVAEVEHYVSSARVWRERLVHLAAALPPRARLTSVAVNPDNLSGPSDEGKLVFAGQLKLTAGEDRMHGVVEIVSTLRRDSVFTAGYRTIRLASTRSAEEGGPVTEFVIECQ